MKGRTTLRRTGTKSFSQGTREKQKLLAFAFKPICFTGSSQQQDYCPAFLRRERLSGSAPPPRRWRVSRCAGEVEEPTRPQEKHAQALIPLSHRCRGPRAPPSTIRSDFPAQSATQLRPRHRIPTPALNPARYMATPAAIFERETSNRWLIH